MSQCHWRHAGIRNERLLTAFRRVPRHVFVDKAYAAEAYADRPLPITEGQTISQPYTVCFMTELLHKALSETPVPAKVLEVGSGSGYQAAILLELGYHVVSIERHRPLSDTAARNLKAMQMETACDMSDRLELVVGDGSQGHSAGAPYNGIMVTAGAPHTPRLLLEQLAPGGVLVVPQGPRGVQEMMVYRKNEKGVTLKPEHHGGFVFVPLIGKDGY